MGVINGTPNPETLTGDDNGDQINGLGGGDKLNGGKGNDTLDGGSGDDTMAGGKGNDVYYVDSSADGVSEKAGEGTDTVYTSANWFTTPGSEIEKLVATGSGQLQLWGNGLSMEIDGNGAVNRLDDGVSPAVLAASAAHFAAAVAPSAPSITLAGGDGSDVYYVHGAGTQVVEAIGQGYDTVRTDLSSFVLPANVEALSYIGVGDFTGTGNAQANVITGGGGNDTLDGAANTDGKGDRLVGGLGDDTYYTHSALDFVAENAGGGFDTVFTTANSAVANPNVEALRFIGSGDFTGFAAATGTSIAGGAGSDKLYGGAGADALDAGSAGSDLLTGKGGADTFILHPNGAGVVHVTDFQPGVDHVELDVNTYDPGTGEPQLNGGVEFDLAFLAYAHGGDGIHGAFAVPFYYDAATGDLYDTTTVPAGPEYGGFLDYVTVPNAVIAHFDNHPALTSSDFVFGLAG